VAAALTGCLSSSAGSTDLLPAHDLSAAVSRDLATLPDLASADLSHAPDASSDDLGLEELVVSFNTTQTATPQYAPKNVVAVWIEDSGGTFERTIGRWANVRKQYLLDWNAKAGANDMDAVSGATQPDHTQRLTATWDMLARGNLPVADGTYTIRMELADKDVSASSSNNEGTFTFNRNGTAST
jgi:hypothetical protein